MALFVFVKFFADLSQRDIDEKEIKGIERPAQKPGEHRWASVRRLGRQARVVQRSEDDGRVMEMSTSGSSQRQFVMDGPAIAREETGASASAVRARTGSSLHGCRASRCNGVIVLDRRSGYTDRANDGSIRGFADWKKKKKKKERKKTPRGT